MPSDDFRPLRWFFAEPQSFNKTTRDVELDAKYSCRLRTFAFVPVSSLEASQLLFLSTTYSQQVFNMNIVIGGSQIGLGSVGMRSRVHVPSS